MQPPEADPAHELRRHVASLRTACAELAARTELQVERARSLTEETRAARAARWQQRFERAFRRHDELLRGIFPSLD